MSFLNLSTKVIDFTVSAKLNTEKQEMVYVYIAVR